MGWSDGLGGYLASNHGQPTIIAREGPVGIGLC